MTINFQKLVGWPYTAHLKRRVLGTAIKFDMILNDLVARLLELGATQVSVGLDFEKSEMRPDGWPRANAVPRSPGVVLVVECPNGPLLLACDTYVHWLHNLHALTIVLGNLRQASLHEVIPAQELYLPFRWSGLEEWLAGKPFTQELSHIRITSAGKGKWTATTETANAWASSRPTGPPPPRTKAPPKSPPPPRPRATSSEKFSSRADAARWLADKTGTLSSQLLVDERAFLEAYRLAARTLHPDAGGEAAQFRRLQNAKAVIERSAPWAR